MTARRWPVHRARAWLLRTAADFIQDGNLEDEAQELIRHSAALSYGWETEGGFRRLLAAALSWKAEDIESAVAEVCGESIDGRRLADAPGEGPREGQVSEPVCARPTNVFLSPGGVEPEEWRNK